MLRHIVVAAATFSLLIFMLLELPAEIASLTVMDEMLLPDGSDEDHDEDIPEKIAQRLSKLGDSSSACIFAGEGVLALRTPQSGRLRNISRRARELLGEPTG